MIDNRTYSRACAGPKKGALAGLVFLCAAAPTNADYRLHAGDVIEITVAAIPDLRQRVTVQLDGTISFPLLGNFTVAGMRPSEARAKIQAVLGSKTFRQRTADGRESVIAIAPDEVTAMVVEYKPIYLKGDVFKPGEQTYRPQMTVRQAIALAGGYGTPFAETNGPVVDQVVQRTEYTSLWTDFAKVQLRVWRIKAELADKNTLDQKEFEAIPLPAPTISQFTSTEAEYLRNRQADYAREKASFQRAIKLADEQIAVLSEQKTKEEQGLQADIDELQRTLDLFGKGALPSPRVTDARRAVLLSSTRKLETAVQLMQLMRQRGDIVRQLEKLDDQRRMSLLKELQDANVELVQIQAKLQGVAEKLERAALIGAEAIRRGESKPELVIFRKQNDSRSRIAVDEDAELEPGDVVEVTLRNETVANMSTQ